MIIAEAIFNSKIRYGIAVYLSPVYDEEDLKVKKLSKHASSLQTLQNIMIRTILGIKKEDHINMQQVRNDIKMMSVNQMNIYHTILEAHNVIRNSSSEQIKIKWEKKCESQYSLRSISSNDIKIPEKPILGYFSYFGAKVFNMLPQSVKEIENTNIFKASVKNWIWDKIPSY